MSVAFNSDDKRLVTASADKTVRLWNPKFSDWMHATCQLVKENLSASQWAQYAPDQPYERTAPTCRPVKTPLPMRRQRSTCRASECIGRQYAVTGRPLTAAPVARVPQLMLVLDTESGV